jgi:hypothetical protein
MPTIFSYLGHRIAIYVDDHAPAHVHVMGSGSMKVDISGDRPFIVTEQGLKAGERRRIMDEILNRQADLLAAWAKIHGDKR